uniref:small RNA 2'-O-methyltransferase-like n=2 Tax=Myxine glutinosa TaxID=7769 RepID=UPI00358E2A82
MEFGPMDERDRTERCEGGVEVDVEPAGVPVRKLLTFCPPVYVQRYQAVLGLVRQYQPQAVVDLGCGECRLLQQLRWEPCIERLAGVDVDRNVLTGNRQGLQPLIADFLRPRAHPLKVHLFQGSVAIRDPRMVGYDFATCLELIEHLDSDVLHELPGMLFGHMAPHIVIVTTPNADFNELIPGLVGFRHWDHRFEWTRREFQNWGEYVDKEYGYGVTFSGVGQGPPGTESYGFCTQIAVFKRRGGPPLIPLYTTLAGLDLPYDMVAEITYPDQGGKIELHNPRKQHRRKKRGTRHCGRAASAHHDKPSP